MKWWVLAAGLLGAAVVPQAMAADLDDGGYPPPWRGGAYGYPPAQSLPPSYYRDDDDDDDNGNGNGLRHSQRDDGDDEDDDDSPRHSRRHADLPPSYEACVHSEQVRDRLTRLGWRDFHSGKALSRSTVLLRARRYGRLYQLRLDRCSGRILAARQLEPRPYAHREYDGQNGSGRWHREYSGGPYAYGNQGHDRPDRYSRPPRRWSD